MRIETDAEMRVDRGHPFLDLEKERHIAFAVTSAPRRIASVEKGILAIKKVK